MQKRSCAYVRTYPRYARTYCFEPCHVSQNGYLRTNVRGVLDVPGVPGVRTYVRRRWLRTRRASRAWRAWLDGRNGGGWLGHGCGIAGWLGLGAGWTSYVRTCWLGAWHLGCWLRARRAAGVGCECWLRACLACLRTSAYVRKYVWGSLSLAESRQLGWLRVGS